MPEDSGPRAAAFLLFPFLHLTIVIVGIDLGTTNSLVAVWRDGAARIVPNALGHALTPSCVGFLDDGTLVIGEAARERLQTHPQLSAALFKRYMGTDRKIRLGSQTFRPEELSSFVLRALKADAEALLGEPVTEAIVTVPAYFSDAQRKATRVAGELAGLKVERLLNEPTAAALAYGLQTREESKFLVFDLGGGTFDVSILELFEGVMEVRASAGDNFLGGEDFATLLMHTFLQRTPLGQRVGTSVEHLPAAVAERLRAAAERAKRTLTDAAAAATLRVDHEGETHTWEVTAEAFVGLAEPLLERLRAPVERALRDARIRPAELDSIVLAGGATRMPMVRRLVSRMFGRFPVVDLNPDEVVALGAAVQAGLKMRDAALDEVVMTDVSPYSMGVEIVQQVSAQRFSEGHFMPIIERNSVVPVSRVERLHTVADNQAAINLRVFQGESPRVADNVFLGELRIPVQPRPAGQVQLDVRFTYDVNGILEAEGTVVETGETHVLVIEENPGVMTPDEVRERLSALAAIKIHPRDQAENRAVMARAERVFEQLLGPQRGAVGNAIAVFQGALDGQESERIREVRTAVKRLLDQVESGAMFD
ncbi:Chaperone protein hscC (Hsc62) (plasmid) [Ralstonia solanacearum]|nr:Chaperone protein hscC (Hsc62) [Ralstonia pseudosolanacearum FQY_4]ANH36205.1 Chaperone protein hscC (Hsc62) [Ralstonia solanacearum]